MVRISGFVGLAAGHMTREPLAFFRCAGGALRERWTKTGASG